MIRAIVYNSNSGFTRQYAEILSKKIGLPMYSLKEAKKTLDKQDEIIFMSWIMAGSIVKIKKASKYSIKAIVAVGMTYDEKQEKELTEKMAIYNPELLINVQGGFDMDRLKGIYKFMMGSLRSVMLKGLTKKENKTEQDEQLLLMMTKGASFVNEENLKRVIEWYFNKEGQI